MLSLFSLLKKKKEEISDEEKERIERLITKLNTLSPEIKNKFDERVISALNNKVWLYKHKLGYFNPEVLRIKEVLYEEEFKKYAVFN